MVEPCSESDHQFIRESLGREPRGIKGIVVRNHNNKPEVIQVASVVEKKPFPTVFWLVCPDINYQIDQLESVGVIEQMQQLILSKPELKIHLEEIHKAYARKRSELMSYDEKTFLEKHGYLDGLNCRGVGGVMDFSRIRCLHMFYAFHKVIPNQIGKIINSYLV